MQLERLHGDRSAAVALLRRAVDLGIDHIDTAQFYGDGFVNGLIREAIRPEDGVVVVTKIGADPDPDGPLPLRAAQRPEELRASVEEGIAWVPFFPLGGAFPQMPKVTDEPAVRDAAESIGCTPSQAGLAWLLRHAPNVLLIPGTANPVHLEANVAAGAITFDDATLAALDAVPSRSADIRL
ncbi:aldo/keto reductase [Nonomuraea sp. KM88]|uniref:aldo/keto reductase n=1 Tax=Nonomuraea sp. KM88 TaxID=3457427 RepID=UPI003FCE7D3B